MDGYEPCVKCGEVIDDWYIDNGKLYCHDCKADEEVNDK